jgi:predicted nucleic acid-binding protein
VSSRIFWDTNLFIYLVEGRVSLADDTTALLDRMRTRGDDLYTSALTLGEVLARPIGLGLHALAEEYERRICRDAIVVPFDRAAARHYAAIRADRGITAPDAVQLACAAAVDTDLFVTNDRRLAGRSIPAVRFVCSLDNLPL